MGRPDLWRARRDADGGAVPLSTLSPLLAVRDGHVTEANALALTELHATVADVVGVELVELAADEHRDRVTTMLADPDPAAPVVVAVLIDGTRRHVELRAGQDGDGVV